MRLTAEEKYEIEQSFSNLMNFIVGEGVRPTENEVVRIAIKLLLEDTKRMGRKHIIHYRRGFECVNARIHLAWLANEYI